MRLVTEQGYNQSEAARNPGIDRGMLGRWVKEAWEDESEAFPGNGKPTAEREELRHLRDENQRPRMERKILKSDMFDNSRRLHSYLGYQSPDAFERTGQLANAA